MSAINRRDYYDEEIVAKFAALSDFFYEFMEFDEDDDDDETYETCNRILQAAMADLGHPDLDMEKLNRSYRYHVERGVDLDAYPEHAIECPDFEKYMNG